MSVIPSNMIELGTKAPAFTLPDTLSTKELSLQELKSDKGTVVMFICNHCPFVKLIISELANTAKEYKEKGISFIAISSNDVESHPDDSPENMKSWGDEFNFSFPYLYDESQEVAKAYDAACTPDFYIFDKELSCVYRGRFDEATPGKDVPVTGKDLRAALDNLLANQPIDSDQKVSMGCNIKWK